MAVPAPPVWGVFWWIFSLRVWEGAQPAGDGLEHSSLPRPPQGRFPFVCPSHTSKNVLFVRRSAGETPGEAGAAVGTALLLLPPSAFIISLY